MESMVVAGDEQKGLALHGKSAVDLQYVNNSGGVQVVHVLVSDVFAILKTNSFE